jgi:Ca2+-binding RTX toxin-like protein
MIREAGVAVLMGIGLVLVGPSANAIDPSRCTIQGTVGNDVLRGTPERDVICGRSGDDVIFGRGGPDLLVGGPGGDILHPGPGHDLARGSGGSGDLVSYEEKSSRVIIRLGKGYGAQGDNAFNMEGAIGTRFGDVLSGDEDEELFRGLGGDDFLNGRSGDDTLEGGSGDDTLVGGGGTDTCLQGSGTGNHTTCE